MKPYRSVLSLLVLREGVANLPKLHCQQVHLGISCVHMYVFSISYHQHLPYTYTLLISTWSRFFMGVAHIVAHGILRSGKQICSFAALLKFQTESDFQMLSNRLVLKRILCGLILLPNFTSQNWLIIAKRFDNHAVVFISGGTKQRVTCFI